MAHATRAEMEALPYYRWYWLDWRANRRVQRMSWQAQGLYRSLLDEFWSEGIIPTDMDALADICGCTQEEMELYWREISPCWTPVEGGYMNAKMDRQRTAKDSERIAKTTAGRKGGLACNSRTRREGRAENSVDHEAEKHLPSKCLASATPNLEAQPDIAIAIAIAGAETNTLVEVFDEDSPSQAPKEITLTPPASPKSQEQPEEEAVYSVFRFYLEQTGRSEQQYAFTAKRKRVGLLALKECKRRCSGDLQKAEQSMALAVEGLTKNAFLMGKNEQRKKYIEWETHLFKNTETMERRWQDAGGLNV